MSDKNFRLKDLRARLSANHYKMTPQRKEILQIFLENNADPHLSAEEVYEILKKKDFDFGLATIYRNVELLSMLGILSKINFDDGRTRYELASSDPKVHHHHHLICLKCKKIFEFEEDLLENLEATITTKSGFEIVNHEVKFFGYCADCKGKDNANKKS